MSYVTPTLSRCHSAEIPQMGRVNYQVLSWKISHMAEPDIPVAFGLVYMTRVYGVLEPLWIEIEAGSLLPPRLVDILRHA